MLLKKEDIGGITQLTIFNDKNGEYIKVIPEVGGMLNGIGLSKKGITYELLSNCEDYKSVLKEGLSEYKGSKLFPFPNRINDGAYTFLNDNYQLDKNHSAEGHAIHGLVYNSKFEVDSFKNTSDGVLTLKYNSTGKEEGYPFLYELTMQYILSEEGFKCITTVENKDNKIIPVADGWHPYYSTGSAIDELLIKIPSSDYIELDENMIPTDKIKSNDNFHNLTLIDKTVFDTCFKLPTTKGIQSIELYDPKKDLSISIWQETGEQKYNFVQLYTHPSRKSIAIEPMSCMPDAFNNQSGLIMLSPKERRSFVFGVKLQ